MVICYNIATLICQATILPELLHHYEIQYIFTKINIPSSDAMKDTAMHLDLTFERNAVKHFSHSFLSPNLRNLKHNPGGS